MGKSAGFSRGLAFLARLARWVVLLVLVPLGIVGLIEGGQTLLGEYSAGVHEFSAYGIDLVTFGGIVLLVGLVAVLLLTLLEDHFYTELKHAQYTMWGRNSIQRLGEWLPKDG